MNNAMGKLQGRDIFLYDLRRAPEKSIPEKRVVYVRCGLPGLMQTSQKEDWIFTRGTEWRRRMRTIIIVQEVEVHRWLLSGIEELTILCCSFFTLVADK